MQMQIGHMQFNVSAANLGFYRTLLGELGWQTIYDDEGMLGMLAAGGQSLWFAGYAKEGVSNDYDGPGLNHLAFSAASAAEVDAVAAALAGRGVELLFETPRHRPEFSRSEADTYYQVMFETPDRILLEVVYTGPK